MSAQQQYEIESSAALAEFQAGKISFQEWNRIQKDAVNKYYSNV